MWKDLSMGEKAALMRIAVDSGINSIDDIVNTYNSYANGGYKPSQKIKKDITNFEGSSMRTNRSFDAEARDFNNVLPQGATSKLTQSQLDSLYSYSYNVGAGNFKKRVTPILQAYIQGNASLNDVKRSMWASKDASMKGLQRRRQYEKNLLGGGDYNANGNAIMNDVNTALFTHYFPSQNNTPIEPAEITPLSFGNESTINLDDGTSSNQEVWTPTFESNSNPTGLFNVMQMFNNIGTPNKYDINI